MQKLPKHKYPEMTKPINQIDHAVTEADSTHAPAIDSSETHTTTSGVMYEQNSAQTHSAETKATPHISIKADQITTVAGLPITNSMILSSIVMVVFIALVAVFNIHAARRAKSSYYYFVMWVMRGLWNLFSSSLGDKTAYFFPLVGSFFFFILLNNWFGLLPLVGSLMVQVAGEHGNHAVPLLRANTADLNTTLALALVTVTATQYFGISHLGLGGYLHKFVNFSSPIAFFVGILEIVSEFSRILSFAFRLFGNIFAGEVLLTVIMFLVPVLASFPFLMLETFVGIVQAIVFSMLSAILYRLAISHH